MCCHQLMKKLGTANVLDCDASGRVSNPQISSNYYMFFKCIILLYEDYNYDYCSISHASTLGQKVLCGRTVADINGFASALLSEWLRYDRKHVMSRSAFCYCQWQTIQRSCLTCPDQQERQIYTRPILPATLLPSCFTTVRWQLLADFSLMVATGVVTYSFGGGGRSVVV